MVITVRTDERRAAGNTTYHSHLILLDAGIRVVVLVQIETPVSSACHEQVSVLREVFRQPHRGLVRFLAQVRKPRGWVLRAHVVRSELRFQGGHDQLRG